MSMQRSINYRKELEKTARKIFSRDPNISIKKLAEEIKKERGASGSGYSTLSGVYRKLRKEMAQMTLA